jgi:hypothetical protein
MASPPKSKSPWRGTEVPQRLYFQNLLVAYFHGHLRKVKVMLKINRKTYFGIYYLITPLRKNIQIFYVTDIAPD